MVTPQQMATDSIPSENQLNPFVDKVTEFEKSIKVQIAKIIVFYFIFIKKLNVLKFLVIYNFMFINMYNVEVPENRTNNDFGKKSQLNLIELNKKSKILQNIFL